MTLYFGPQPWGEPRRWTGLITPNSICAHCDEPIKEDEYGVYMPHLSMQLEFKQLAYHRECDIRLVAGSIGHQRHLCSCYGGTYDDPPGMSKRKAALCAANFHLKLQEEKMQKVWEEKVDLRAFTAGTKGYSLPS